MSVMIVFSLVLLVAGAFFLLIGNIGLVRFPDFYSRAHAVGVGDTLGVMLVILGLIFLEGLTLNSVKLLLIIIFIMLTNPTSTHALVKAAMKFRLMPWFRKDKEKR